MNQTVALVVLDSLRYDVFQSYLSESNGGILKNIASEGIHYEGAIAPAPWSLPSHASIFTGHYPREHGATRVTREISPNVDVLTSRLQNNGITTGCFTANSFIQPEFGFSSWDIHRLYDRWYQSADVPNPEGTGLELAKSTFNEVFTADKPAKTFVNGVGKKLKQALPILDDQGKQLISDAASWLNRSDGSRFLFVNLMETHFGHRYLRPRHHRLRNIIHSQRLQQLNQKFEARRYYTETVNITNKDQKLLRKLIKSEISYIDQQLQQLLKALENTSGDTLIIICSDHGDAFGEGIGESNFAGHVVGIEESIVHVPLLIQGTNTVQDKVQKRVSLTDIYHTIASAFGLSAKSDLRKPSTCPKQVGTENTRRLLDLINPEEVRDKRYLSNRRAVYPRDNLVTKWVGVDETFRTISPRGDKAIKSDGCSKTARNHVTSFFDSMTSRSTGGSDITDETATRLRELGYL